MSSRLERMHGKAMHLQRIHDPLISRPYSDLNINPFVLRSALEILNKMQHKPCAIYEFGCGAGALGSTILKSCSNCIYTGIEPNTRAASKGLVKGLTIYNTTCEEFVLEPKQQVHDRVLLIYADVLEHLIDPWDHLNRVVQMFQGSMIQIVASVPNFFHHSNLTALGNWSFEYEEWGVMDFTHLRFFSLRDMTEMLDCVGFKVDFSAEPPIPAFDPIGQRIYQDNIAKVPTSISFGDLSINVSSAQALAEICAYQFTIIARYSNET